MTAPNFANRTLWTGDNMDVLRGMNSDCVDLIYLDPPFNSNRNYAAPIVSKAAGAASKQRLSRRIDRISASQAAMLRRMIGEMYAE